MQHIVTAQRKFFYTGQTKAYAFRMEQLKKLKKMLQTYETDIYEALYFDLSKSRHEVLTTELGILHAEIDFTMKHLQSWMADEPVPAPLTHKGTKSLIRYEPYGVVLIIAPWNYPLQLTLAPLIGAIAAGNTAVIKPSEFAPYTAKLLKRMILTTFDTSYVTVIEGDKEVSEQLLEEKFDYIFFTGSTRIGKAIMEKASKHLTPLTLELGGKSPAIIDASSPINLSAKRIAWGKFTNAGQTCVAPDYVYVHETVYERFLKALVKQITLLYGAKPLQNKNYVRIIHERHFTRLRRLLESGTVYFGGDVAEASLRIEPTVLVDVTWEDPVMQEEIFGPILPVMPFKHVDEVITTLQEKDKPLALYYFGKSKENEAKIFSALSFGGGCVNDTLYHLANPHLPFGGVGTSGIGAYHGKYSFETFSHRKSILKQTTAFDLPVRYPGSKLSEAVIKRILT